jgi:hypothetical protein
MRTYESVLALLLDAGLPYPEADTIARDLTA